MAEGSAAHGGGVALRATGGGAAPGRTKVRAPRVGAHVCRFAGCTAQFAFPKELREHTRVHTRITAVCPVCDGALSNERNLVRHCRKVCQYCIACKVHIDDAGALLLLPPPPPPPLPRPCITRARVP